MICSVCHPCARWNRKSEMTGERMLESMKYRFGDVLWSTTFTWSLSVGMRRYEDFLQRSDEVMTSTEIRDAEDYSINHLQHLNTASVRNSGSSPCLMGLKQTETRLGHSSSRTVPRKHYGRECNYCWRLWLCVSCQLADSGLGHFVLLSHLCR